MKIKLTGQDFTVGLELTTSAVQRQIVYLDGKYSQQALPDYSNTSHPRTSHRLSPEPTHCTLLPLTQPSPNAAINGFPIAQCSNERYGYARG